MQLSEPPLICSSASEWSDYIGGFQQHVDLYPDIDPVDTSGEELSMINTTAHAANGAVAVDRGSLV